MRRLFFGIFAGMATLAATSCASAEKATTVDVEVRINLCVSSGICYGLQAPEAEVELKTQDGRHVANAKTTEDGIARLRLGENAAGQHVVVVKTPLWKDREKSSALLVVAGSHHSLTMWGHLGETCCAP